MNKQQEPRLRFQGFTGEWEEKKLGEVVQRITRKNTNLDSLLPLTISAQNGLIAQTEFFDNQVAGKNLTGYYLIENGEFAYNKSYSNGYPWGAIKRLDRHKNGVLSTLYILFKPTFASSQYLVSYFDGTNWHGEVASIAGEGARNHGLLNIPVHDFFEIKILLPCSLQEQTAIGNFFRRLDSLIAESRAVLEKSRQLKKAMLAKMFPANGEKIPKIRFKGFKGEWERKKLGAEVEIVGGGTPDTTNSTYWNGDIDWYSPTEIGEAAYANGSVKKITLLGLQKSAAQILPANRTVLFTSRASIGDMAILTKDGATNQGFQSFVVGERLDVYFLYTMGFKIKDYALKNASGSTFLEISKNTLLQMEFFAPSLKEQTAIGNFFRQLDETIALQSAEVEKLNQLKKGLLAAMLV
mgnify:CR=1 FL=1